MVLLRERPVADISLRELSERVGLAKSNVLRYFDSREAIFLEVLDRSWTAWLDGLEKEVAALSAPAVGYRREIEMASSVATALIREPLLCELLATMGGVLERNISVDFARSFKRRAMQHTARLAALVQGRLPALSTAAAERFAAGMTIITSGLWPYSHPTEAVASVMAEFGSPPSDQMFAGALTDGLTNQLVGLAVREAAGG